jgi:hypothetical protein
MAIFSCTACGYKFEQMVATVYQRKILNRMDTCVKCEKPRYFRFISHSGSVGKLPNRNHGTLPSNATMWWRKQRDGKIATAPLDAVCKRSEW